MGHSDVIQSALTKDYDNQFFKVNFTQHNQDDFNGDNIPDQLICNNTIINKVRRINIKVINGKTKTTLFVWNWGESQSVKGASKIAVTGCDVIYLRPNRPSIVVGTVYMHATAGARVIAPQFIMHNIPSQNRLIPKHIKLPENKHLYSSATRSLKCTQVPLKLRKLGVKDGAYCFFAAYDSNLNFNRGYGTATSFVKFEQGSGDSFIVKDLTAQSGLPWSGGMLGTNMSALRQVRLCSGSRKYDGLHMMGAAFLDYNKDGLTDLITVGQHASIRSHQMVINNSKPEKFSFSNGYIADVNRGGMSEFLKIMSLDENEKYANSSCVYISGEKGSGCGSVPDHMRCFKNGKWETKMPEGPLFSSHMSPVSIKANGNGQYIIKAADTKSGKQIGNKYFKLGAAYEKKIVLAVSTKVSKGPHNLIVNGWACVPNTRWRPRITISNKSHHKEAGYRVYFQGITHNLSEPMLSKRCLQPNSFPLRFRAVIPKNRLTSPSGKFFIQADFYHTNKINMTHVNRVINY